MSFWDCIFFIEQVIIVMIKTITLRNVTHTAILRAHKILLFLLFLTHLHLPLLFLDSLQSQLSLVLKKITKSNIKTCHFISVDIFDKSNFHQKMSLREFTIYSYSVCITLKATFFVWFGLHFILRYWLGS